MYFYLKKVIGLSEVHPEPEFTFNRTTPIATDSFQCRIAECNGIRRPKKEEVITVCITRTHFGVPLDIIGQWMEKFGQIVTQPRIITNANGVKLDRILVDIAFDEEIAEWLPILSTKARIYYPGIQRQCHKCYEAGHEGWSCKNGQVTWKEYCEQIFNSGKFPRELFGHWIEPVELQQQPRQGQDENPKPQSLKAFLDQPGALKELMSFIGAVKEVEKEKAAKKTSQKRTYNKKKQ